MPNEPRTFRIFYAWQSDLPEQYNHRAIRQALIRAGAQLSQEASAAGRVVTFVVDDATREMIGSENIPTSIMEKIKTADFFVGDISCINADQEVTKRTPNPNVVFELGFAVSVLGWKRIMMLINTLPGGSPEDMPFDFDRQRSSPFELGEGRGTQGSLNALVEMALRQMAVADAPRPTLNIFNVAATRRERDLTNLRWLLKAVHLLTLDEHATSSPRSLSAASAYFAEIIVGIVGSSQFHLNDEVLASVVSVLVSKWAESTNPDNYFSERSNPRYYLYIASCGDQRLAELQALRNDLRTAVSRFLEIVRTSYPEVDLRSTSEEALSLYARHLDDIEEAL